MCKVTSAVVAHLWVTAVSLLLSVSGACSHHMKNIENAAIGIGLATTHDSVWYSKFIDESSFAKCNIF